MAVQATAEQSAAFAKIQQDVEVAATPLKTFRQLLEKTPTAPLQPDYAATPNEVEIDCLHTDRGSVSTLGAGLRKARRATSARRGEAEETGDGR